MFWKKDAKVVSEVADLDDEADPEFTVRPQHLLEQISLEEIERRERVADPLHAVPDLPFGHLNGAWKAFLQGRTEAAGELWSFSAREPTPWGQDQLRSGYVFVRRGTPEAHFLTVWKDLPGDSNGSTWRTRAGGLMEWLRKMAE